MSRGEYDLDVLTLVLDYTRDMVEQQGLPDIVDTLHKLQEARARFQDIEAHAAHKVMTLVPLGYRCPGHVVAVEVEIKEVEIVDIESLKKEQGTLVRKFARVVPQFGFRFHKKVN